MRVLFDPQIFLIQKHGGISRYFVEIIKQFQSNKELGIEPVFFTKKVHNVEAFESFEGLTLLNQARTGEPYRSLLETLLKPVEPQGIDLVHHTFYLPGFREKFRTLPNAVTLYDMIPEKFGARGKFGNAHYFKKSYLKKADIVLSISDTSTKEMIDVYGTQNLNVKTTYLGVAEEFKPGLQKVSWAPQKYLLYTGQRDGYKDIATAYHAFAAADVDLDVKLLLVGGGELKDYEKSLLSELGISDRVLQASVRNADLPGIYSNAIALIFTSTYEGFGFPPIEAMASGIPALVAETPIAHEIYGDSVSYFKPGSIRELRDLVEKLFSSPKSFKEKVAEGLNVATRFTWKACAQATAQSYFDFFRN